MVIVMVIVLVVVKKYDDIVSWCWWKFMFFENFQIPNQITVLSFKYCFQSKKNLTKTKWKTKQTIEGKRKAREDQNKILRKTSKKKERNLTKSFERRTRNIFQCTVFSPDPYPFKIHTHAHTLTYTPRQYIDQYAHYKHTQRQYKHT